MNIENYIASGILEQYVLGHLSASEASAVEKMCIQYPEIAKEVEVLSDTFEKYALIHAKEAPLHLKETIIARVQPNVFPQNTKLESYRIRAFAIVASILFLISAGLNVYQQTQLNKKKKEINNLYAGQEVLAQSKNEIETSLEEVRNKLEFYQSPDLKQIKIKGSHLSPKSFAMVNWNEKSKEAVLSHINLPKPSAGMQYQLWAIVEGKPVDLGVFNLEQNEIQINKRIENPAAFAVTLEEAGGKPNPNLEQLYLIGNV